MKYKIKNEKKEYLYYSKDMDGFVWIENGREHKFYESGFIFTKSQVNKIVFDIMEDEELFSIEKVK